MNELPDDGFKLVIFVVVAIVMLIVLKLPKKK